MNKSKIKPGFIQSTVSISVISGGTIELPHVVGRSFAASIACLLQTDFPHAVVEITDQHQSNHKQLAASLVISDRVGHEVQQAIKNSRPGICLLQRLGLDTALGAVRANIPLSVPLTCNAHMERARALEIFGGAL